MLGDTDPSLEALGSNAFPLEGLVEYSFSETQWTNLSSTSHGGTSFGGGAGFAVLGEGLYVPIFGAQGILIFLGGDAPSVQTQWATEGLSLAPMNQIVVYDIDSRTFHVQTAGGTIPKSRTSFCAVGAGSSENSTWETYVATIFSQF